MNWTPIRTMDTLHFCQELITGKTELLAKTFPDTHSYIMKIFNTRMEPKHMSDWMTTEIT